MKKYYYSFLTMLTIPLAGMSTDIYLPSLPAITAHFGVHKAFSQFTVTAFTLAMGFAQLVAGPVSDALGRKKQLLIALLLQAVCILTILYSPNIDWMISVRFLQGLAAAFMVVPARATLNDIFTGVQLKKQLQYLTIAFAIGPIVAPFIGGFLQEYSGWHANFYFILIYVLILLVLWSFTYQETAVYRTSFSIHKFLKNYQIILSNLFFLIGSIWLGLFIGIVGLFNVVGTFIIQTALHQSAIVYGHIALSMGLAWLFGNLINRFTFNINKSVKTKVALSIFFLAALTAVMLGLEGYFNLPSVILPTFFMIMMGGIVFSAYVSECLTLFPRMAASANGILFSITWFVFSFFTYIATLLKIHSLFPLGLTYILIAATSLLMYFGLLLRLEKMKIEKKSIS